MGLVTTFAITCGHVGAMRLVTLGTERNLAMHIVAEAARQSGVFTLDLFQLDNLLSMTGEALIGNVVGQLDNFRGMWIVVTAQTTGKVVVRFAAVALAAGRDDFFNCRWMAGVTILAADLGFVGAATDSNRLRC